MRLMRSQTKKYKKDVDSFRVGKSIVTRASVVQKSEYGYFQLRQRIHSDQAPIDLDHAAIKTYCPREGQDQPLVSGQPSGDKRFAMLQVSMHADPNYPQPKIGTKNCSYFKIPSFRLPPKILISQSKSQSQL